MEARVRRRAATLLPLVAVLTLSMAAPTSATSVRIHHSMFGAEDASSDSASLTRIKEGSVRLWGVGARWDEVETRRHHYDWTRLDQLVSAAQAAHANVTMTVAMTPHFYASSPTRPPRHVADYRRFVAALMKRYRDFHGDRGIATYQVWNEVNISTFWTGTTRKLAELTRVMSRTRDRLDPHAKVIGPAMVTRLPFELHAIAPYYAYRLRGVPMWRYVDAVSVHLYPLPRYGRRIGVPEDSMRLLSAARKQLRSAGVPASKPIWNTEINYGVNAGPKSGLPAIPISTPRQASNVMRTYLLNAAHGVKRVYWYRYDMGRTNAGGTIGDTLLSVPRVPHEMTPAGHAYVLAQQWMHGTLVGTQGHRPCARDLHGTYTCLVRDGSTKRYIYWNPFHRAKVRLPARVHHRQDVLGAVTSVEPRSRMKVNYRPVMVSR